MSRRRKTSSKPILRCNATRETEDNKIFVVLYDDSGFVLTLMKASHSTEVKYPGYFHIGFWQESKERVNEIYQRLKDDGFDVQPPEQHHAWTFYFQAPSGFTIEIMA